jgi:hypothetical protein
MRKILEGIITAIGMAVLIVILAVAVTSPLCWLLYLVMGGPLPRLGEPPKGLARIMPGAIIGSGIGSVVYRNPTQRGIYGSVAAGGTGIAAQRMLIR